MLKEKSYYPNQVSAQFLYQTDSISLCNWQSDLSEYKIDEIKLGRMFSNDSLHINFDDTPELKVKKIATYLVSRLHSQLGSPKEYLFNQSPWMQLQTIRSKESEFYCTQYSDMFTFFCRINGVLTRQIESKGINDRHIFNEVYLAQDSTWAFVDLTNNIIFSLHENKTMNLLQIYQDLQNKLVFDSVLSVKDSMIKVDHLNNFLKPLLYNFDSNCRFYYYQEEDLQRMKNPLYKIKSFLLNKPATLIYSNKTYFAYWFIIKYILIVLLILLILQFLKRLVMPKKM